MLHFEGLRKKIIKNYFTIIMITVTLFEGMFIAYIQNYYYDYVRQTLKYKAENTYSQYNDTNAMDSSSFETKINNLKKKI